MKPVFVYLIAICTTAIIAVCVVRNIKRGDSTPSVIESAFNSLGICYDECADVGAHPDITPKCTEFKKQNMTEASRLMKTVACNGVSAYDAMSAESYAEFADNRFMSPSRNPLSTFSIDVDVASYANMRRYINQGQLPPADAIRVEEFVNYFSYAYPQPSAGHPVHIGLEVGACPWSKTHRLVRIGLKAKDIPMEKLPAANFVFLIDVSGSMDGPNRLGLVKSSMKMLTDNIRDIDRVAIVVYGCDAKVLLPSTPGSKKRKIKEAIESLEAGGYTAGEAGIRLAYQIAEKNFIKGGNNRIVLCSDGDFNFGISDEHGLEELVSKERKKGIFLSVLGYGMGNYKDSRMQVLAEKGNGNQAYIDNLQEARKVLISEFGSTLFTVAEDVKLQVEFNPSQVQAYRLVGYESRILKDEDFNDDTKDAGDIGAGHTVTAFYEVIPVGAKGNISGTVDALKYQQPSETKSNLGSNSKEMLTVKLRYKNPGGKTSRLLAKSLTDKGGDNVSGDFRFASAVAMYGQLLRSSDFKGDATYQQVVEIAQKGLSDDRDGYRREFIRLVEIAQSLNSPKN